MPVPLDYKVSLRDTLTVLLTGSKNVRYKLGVNLDGTIQFPELGSISVVNRTLEEVNNELSNLISASYVGVEMMSTSLNLVQKDYDCRSSKYSWCLPCKSI